MKIIITGANGFVGKELCEFFGKKNCEIIAITRHPFQLSLDKFINVIWDGKIIDTKDLHLLENADAIINLAGKSVNCRYTEKNKTEILQSRIDATHAVGTAINQLKNPPALWLNSSSATIYRFAQDQYQTEAKGEIGVGFSVNVCKQWEKTFYEHPTTTSRKVAMRISLVIGKNGGVVPVFLNLAKFGLCGPMAGGKQKFSWISANDLCRAIEFMIENKNLDGSINFVSPAAITNAQLMKIFQKKVNWPIAIPQPLWMLKLGAFMMGTETELIVKSRWSYPEKLLNAGFEFNDLKIKL